ESSENTAGKEGMLSDDELSKLYEQSFKVLEEGKIVDGVIISKDEKGVIVDVGYKSEGFVAKEEFRDYDKVKVGDKINVMIEEKENEDGIIVLSKLKADRSLNWEKTISSCEEGKILKGRIFRKVKGGLMVDIGMEAFLPASQIDVKHISNMDDYIGKEYDFKIIKINPQRKNIVVSRRELLEEERQRSKSKLIQNVEEGQIRKGFVKNITDFGAFIDLGGIDGLLHITDMTWGRISHPSEMLAVGDHVEVMILEFDREKERISLGLKQKTANPWEDIEEKYPVGSKIKGKVVSIMPYGAFVEVEKGIEGLIHISELSWTKRINHPSEMLAVGDSVEAMVLNIDKSGQKISLGLKQTEHNPWEKIEEKYPVGTKIRGKVRNLTNYGAFVELEDGIDGLIHISDMSWTRKINIPSEILKKGDLVEAQIISIDKDNKKIALGMKQLQPDPWEQVKDSFKIGDVVKGKVNKITKFGAFVEIGEGVEGLIHISQLSDKPVEKVTDVLKEGQEVEAMVIKVEKDERKIALSLKDAAEPKTGGNKEETEDSSGEQDEEPESK
ncbi:MAG: 30S ribosomal protein S1, partial [Candidatus Aureabacteria bacterium]|nr:30S ribosomal protein S1 [Candidatus Auribacterota bacterium]